ncbi:[NiFe]-hydrogenase assembly chaperone HybE [Halomonas sp. McH1-25]|uniref:[NiFe]-hydrogenase assembly chaperone HybE n=1 Tax=unclassified Halomonas TaxID=2609666 RepID=UPI001EF4595A|nr:MULTISPECIES: [NiFe]-hydrogenase assembly chaperone HybE [unclassified Halomonas]MCG7598530.1 [NiFe]-hydrogenase assembly chaperone HybE [Halomonas sp. McH1-25]MCP1341782.1 [NiFe]-hydrogenase assembly chaperone HybE [Halomonas sp. FL8]MCP1360999.1 [NiFe]-hydrogenase assembly chaperone HybE [Halomonas sp. BBD45]MCP1364502.1 [NiFe]-hydrogenase assembly chaperone HybE [Halomonas sp. BBD48]
MQALGGEDYQRLERLAREWLKEHALEYKTAERRNPSLGVDALCFQAMGDDLIGVLVTPVALSLVVLPARSQDSLGDDTVNADRRIVTLPSGRYAFMPVSLAAGRERLWCCELLDDMSALHGPDEASRLAQRVMQRVMSPAEGPQE